MKFGDYLDYSKTKYTSNRNKKVKFICPIHGLFTTTTKAHLSSKNACKKCGEYERYTERTKRLLKEANKIHNGFYDYSKVEITSNNNKVTVICPIHGEYKVKLGPHARGNKCPNCSIESDRLSQDEFINKAKSIHGNKYDYSETVYHKGSLRVSIICPIHGKFTQRASSHLEGIGCKNCFLLKNRNTQEEFIKNARAIHGNLYDYSKTLYIHSKSKVEVICNKHGSFRVKPNSHISSKGGCPKCSFSKGETMVATILRKYNISFIEQYKIEPYIFRYDFFLPKDDILIEYHGPQHYMPVKTFGGKEAYLKCLSRDRFKRFVAHWSRKDLIELPYKLNNVTKIEEVLIRVFKRRRFYWCKINEEVMSFKRPGSAYDFFKIDGGVLLRDFPKEVQKKYPNVITLF